MKKFLIEIFDPVKDFYKIRKSKETLSILGVPIVAVLMVIASKYLWNPVYNIELESVFQEFTNQLITVIALFISFSMAYLSIILTSSSHNVCGLKVEDSRIYKLNGVECKLYQVLLIEITYVLVFEICFLLFLISLKWIVYMLMTKYIVYLLAMEIGCLVHILLMVLIIVKNIYFAFWKAK